MGMRFERDMARNVGCADTSMAGNRRNKLREKVASGELEAAESKAAVLQEMCNNLRFDPASAAQLHMSIYRQKLVSFLEKKALTAEDEAQLGKMRRMMCLQKGEVDAIHKELCGAIVKRAVEDALSAGYEGFSPDDRANVKKAIAVRRPSQAERGNPGSSAPYICLRLSALPP